MREKIKIFKNTDVLRKVIVSNVPIEKTKREKCIEAIANL
jgi:hypothetical protein